MYWTAAQMLAHLTVNGASLRPGDLYASGHGQRTAAASSEAACSNSAGPAPSRSRWPTAPPAASWSTATRSAITATAPGPDGSRVGIAEVTGRILPAHN